MGTSLTGLTPATTYDSLIKVGNNNPLSATAVYLSDGLGTDTPISLSTTLVGIGLNTPRTILDIYNYATPPVITVSSQKAFDVAGTLIGGIQGIQHATLTASSGAMYFKSETGNAAQGKITFETGSALGSSSEKMVIGFNGNVGIGITAPTARLNTKGSGATSATFSFVAENSTNTRSIIFTDEGKLSFNSSTTSKMNIDSGTTAISFSSASSDILTGGAVGIQYATGLANANGISYTIGPNESHSFRKTIQLDGGISANSYYTMALVDSGATYTGTYQMIVVIPTVNLTGAGAKNVVGYTFKPTLTSSANTKLFGAVFENGGLLIGGAATSANASASLEVISTTQGILPPRMTTIQKNAIATPAAGLMVYDTTTNKLCCYNGTIWNDLF